MSETRRPTPSSPVQSEPTYVPTRTAERRGPWRWLVAFTATILLVVAGSGLVAFAQTGGGPAAGPSFLPSTTPIYVEVRADLPSGQADALAQMMTAFPGFADAATFDMKVDEALDAWISDATQGMFSWTADIASWFDGQISFGVTALPDMTTAVSGSFDLPFLAGLSVSDPAAFQATIDKLMEMAGSDVAESVTTEQYQDATITVAPELAFAPLDDLVLFSTDVDQVKLGIDVLAGEVPSLASGQAFQTAFARVPDGHIVAGYIAYDGFLPLIEAAIEAGQVPGFDPAMLDMLPVDLTMYAAVRPDGATFEAFVTPGETGSLNVGESDLAASFPSDTQVYLEARELGSSVRALIEQAMAQLGSQMDPSALEGIEQMLGGPLEDVLSWAGDVAIGGSLGESELWVGIATEIADVDAATERVRGLLAIASALAMQEDSPVSVTSSDIGGVTVTTITLDPEAMGGDPLPVPIEPSLSVAISGDRLLLGTGSFVTTSLGLAPDSSLQADARYTDAVEAVGIPNGGFLYLDITGLRTALEPILAFAMPEYADTAPLIEPFDRVAAGTHVLEDGTQAFTVQLYLR